MNTSPFIVASQQVVRNINRTAILNILRKQQPISRVAIAQKTKLHKSTVTSIVKELIKEGLVQEISVDESTGGRRPKLLKLSITNIMIGAINIRRNITILGVLDLDGNILRKSTIHTELADPKQFLHKCSIQLRQISRQFSTRKLLAVGVSVPGPVDKRTGTIFWALSLGWKNIPARKIIEQVLNTRVHIENDANAVALSELFFRKNIDKESDFVAVLLGEQVETSVVLDNHLMDSAKTSGFGFAHTTVAENGLQCVCGSKGCWEAYISDGALMREYNRLVELKKVKKLDKRQLVVYNLTALSKKSMVELSWKTDCQETWQFNIYRSENPEFVASPQTLIGSSAINSYLDGEVMANTTYYYKVSAVNYDNQEGEPSLAVKATLKKGLDVFTDNFETNTVAQYSKKGDINIRWEKNRLILGDGQHDKNDLVIFRGNYRNYEVTGIVKPVSAGIYDSIGVLAKVQDGENWYCGLITYGKMLKEKHSLAFMRCINNTGKKKLLWLAFYPFTVELGKEYMIKMRVSRKYLHLKSWEKDTPEVEDWQLSIVDDSGWESGGVGFRHFGLGAEVHSLIVNPVVPRQITKSVLSPAQADDTEQQLKIIIEKVQHGDLVAIKAVIRIGKWLGVGLANIINIVGVRTIILGGYVAELWDILKPEVEKELEKRLAVLDISKIKIIPFQLSEEVMLQGAASPAMEEIFGGYRIIH